jgi:hypothetical protein
MSRPIATCVSSSTTSRRPPAISAGYGDDRALSEQDRLEKTGRQLFVKISDAFQR